MSTTETRVLQVSRHFEASTERVFDAWLDPATAGKWLFATPTGKMVRLEIDARPGGSFVIVEQRDGEDVEHQGEYVEVDRPSRLVFTFAVPKYSPLVTEVELAILPAGSGCELTLTHQGVLEEWAASTEQGWHDILDGLARSLAAR